MLLLVGGTLGWLLGSASGRDVVLHQLTRQLPDGSTLQWHTAQGALAGPLQLGGFQLSMPMQRDADCQPTPARPCAQGTLRVNAETLAVDPAVLALLSGRLQLDRLALRGVTIDLPRDDSPFKLPTWPDVLPTLGLPMTVQADDIQIDALHVLEEEQPTFTLQTLRGGLRAGNGWLQVDDLRAESDRGQFRIHGRYAPREAFRSDLTASVVLPAPSGRTPATAQLRVQGDLNRLTISLDGRAPTPLQAQLVLQDGHTTPRWSLQLRGDGIEPALLTAGQSTGEPLALQLQGQGSGGRATLSGRVRQGGFSAVLQPSKLTLENQRLQVHPLVLDVLDGRVTAKGDVNLRDPAQASVQLAVDARGLQWHSEDGAADITTDADMTLTGRLEQWALSGQMRLARGKEHAVLDMAGQGNLEGGQIRSLKVTMPQGTLDATGKVDWAPTLRWQAAAHLAGFDPGYFVPDWPGAVRGSLTSTGEQGQDGHLRATLDLRDIAGQLRQRPLQGHAHLGIDGTHYRGDVALGIGASRLQAKGEVNARLAIDASLAPLHLDDLLPNARGSLRGTFSLGGRPAAPTVTAALEGRELAVAGVSAARLQANGQLGWDQGDGRLQLHAEGLNAGLPLHQLHLELRGALARLQVTAEAAGEIGRLQLAANGRQQGSRWSGALTALQIAPRDASHWSLSAPAQWSWDTASHRGTLSASCLQASLGGQLCADADWPRTGLQLRGLQLPLALAADWLPKRDDGRPWVFTGTADLDARLLPAGRSWQASAQLRSTSGGVRDRLRARRNVFGYHDLVLDARLGPQHIEAQLQTGLEQDGHATAVLNTGWDAHAPLTGTLQVNTRALTWLELLSPDIVQPTGALTADLRLAGTRTQPLLGGQGALTEFATEIPALGIALHDGALHLQAREDGSARIHGSLRSGEGQLAVEGQLGWLDASTPLQLKLSGNQVLLADTRQLRVLASPDIAVSYRAGTPLQVTGRVTIPTADIHLERLEMGVSPSADVVVLDPENTLAGSPLAIDLDLAVTLGEAVHIDGYGMQGNLTGNLRVRQPPQREARATGALDIAGRYRAYGQDLRITRGRLIWSNSEVADPLLDLRAEREIGEVVAGVEVKGRASAPQPSVYSQPAMSQSDALAYLTLGRPVSSLTKREAQQVGAAKTALNAGVGLLAAQLGQKIGLDDAGVSESRALGSQVLGVGKYLSPRLYVSYGVSLLGTGQVVTLKYLLRKGFDLQVESSTVENRASVNWRTEK